MSLMHGYKGCFLSHILFFLHASLFAVPRSFEHLDVVILAFYSLFALFVGLLFRPRLFVFVLFGLF